MAIHSSILAWEIPWIEEPGGLQFMGSQKSQTQLTNYTQQEDMNTPHPPPTKYTVHALEPETTLAGGEAHL